MVKKLKAGSNRLRSVYWSGVGMLSMMLVSLQPVLAAAIALIVRMISRNQRAVDEATSWLKP